MTELDEVDRKSLKYVKPVLVPDEYADEVKKIIAELEEKSEK